MNRRPAIIGALAVVCSVALVAWRGSAPRAPTPHAAVLYDRSGSSTGGCGALAGTVGALLWETPLARRSTVTVFATGDDASVAEPIEVSRLVGLTSTRSIEGAHGAARHREAALSTITRACAALTPTIVSPILLGVRRTVEGLRARGCGSDSGCRLVVMSDLEENVDAALSARIRGRRGAGSTPKVDNTGIDVLLCGTSDTRGPSDSRQRGRLRTAAGADRLRDAWRAVFTMPELVRFDPHCPRGPEPLATR